MEIEVKHVVGVPIAVVRDRVSLDQLSIFVPAACGEVWSFIRANGIQGPGRNVAVYGSDGIVEAGAEVAGRFQASDRILSSQLPGGRVAVAIHLGPYQSLARTHSAIREWCANKGLRTTGTCWEVYGHWDESWNEDPSRIRTDVYHLLRDEPGTGLA